MKIAVATHGHPSQSAGGGNSLYWELAVALASKGHEVAFICLTEGDEVADTIDGVTLRSWRLPERALASGALDAFPVTSYALSRAVALHQSSAEFLGSYQPDVIDCPDFGALGLLFSLSRRHPLVIRCLCPYFHVMGLNYDQLYSQADRILCSTIEALAVRQADARVASSRNIAAVYSATHGIPGSSFTIVRNPLARIDATGIRHQTANDPAFRLVYAGRLEKLKGCDVLIEALPKIQAQLPEFHLSLVGDDGASPHPGITMGDILRRRVAELGFGCRVTFAGGQSRQTVARYLAESDLCIVPSRYDSSPYACLEAMAQGVAVVSTTAGGIPEHIEHGVSGWLVEPDSPEALADAIVRLCLDTKLRERIALAGREHVEQMCSHEIAATRSIEVYEQAIAAFGKKRAHSQFAGGEFDDNAVAVALATMLNRPALVAEPHSTLVAQALRDLPAQDAWNEGYRQGVAEAQAQFSAGFSEGRKSLLTYPLRLARRLTGMRN